MEQHRFILDNTRPVRLFKCPSCSRKELKRYVDLESGEYLPEHVGRCNRESKCGYHCTAKQYFQGLGLPSPRVVSTKRPEVTLEPGLIPIEVFKASCEAEMTNHFIDFLSQRYGKSTSLHAKKRFMIGSSKRWPGATCFWQVDENLKVRTGKVILYNKDTCHRVKQPYNHIDWSHGILKKRGILPPTFNLQQCLFGLHQLATESVTSISIVESEKTAVIASIELPGTTWMAVGGLSMLIPERLHVIKAYPIVLYPDLKCFNKWQSQAERLRRQGFTVTVSNLLETAKFVTQDDREKGLDLADYLLRLPRSMTPLQRMEQKNPNITDLIKRLGLELMQ